MAKIYHVKTFASSTLAPVIPLATVPMPTPTLPLTDIENQINAFIATLDPVDVRDIRIETIQVGKYGDKLGSFGYVTYLA